jgi:hypothetical protein
VWVEGRGKRKLTEKGSSQWRGAAQQKVDGGGSCARRLTVTRRGHRGAGNWFGACGGKAGGGWWPVWRRFPDGEGDGGLMDGGSCISS